MKLDQVVQRAKRDIAHKYVYVMMPIPQLETLLAGLEELQRENAAMKEAMEWYAYKPYYSSASTDPNYPYQRTPLVYEDGGKRARSVLSTLTKEESA